MKARRSLCVTSGIFFESVGGHDKPRGYSVWLGIFSTTALRSEARRGVPLSWWNLFTPQLPGIIHMITGKRWIFILWNSQLRGIFCNARAPDIAPATTFQNSLKNWTWVPYKTFFLLLLVFVDIFWVIWLSSMAISIMMDGGHSIDSAKNHKRQRRKRQSVTAKGEKSQTPKFVYVRLGQLG